MVHELRGLTTALSYYEIVSTGFRFGSPRGVIAQKTHPLMRSHIESPLARPENSTPPLQGGGSRGIFGLHARTPFEAHPFHGVQQGDEFFFRTLAHETDLDPVFAAQVFAVVAEEIA